MSARRIPHLRSLTLSCAGATLVVALLYLVSGLAHERLHIPYRGAELKLQDIVARQPAARPAPRDPGLIFLCDDHASHTLDQLWDDELTASPALPLMKKRTWSRAVWAHVIERLMSAGAGAVVLDYIYLGEDDGDPEFRAALDKYAGRVVIGANFEEVQLGNSAQMSFQPPERSLIPGESETDPRVGFVNFWPEEDGVVRRAWFRMTVEKLNHLPVRPDSRVYESLAARAVRAAGLSGRFPKEHEGNLFRYAYKGEMLDEENKPPSLFSIFVPGLWEANFKNGAVFKDKIVLVGPEGRRNKDLAKSPFGIVAGPELHLNAMNALLTGEFLEETPLAIDLALIVAGGMLAWSAGRLIGKPPLRLALLALAGIAWFYAAVGLYNMGLVAPVLSPTLAMLGSGFIFTAAETITERLERARLRRTFERYVSRDVVEELVDNPEGWLNLLGGQRRNITVMFSDVRGFTTLTESADAAKLVEQLNEYFTEMVRIVFEHSGTLDKFIGDAVMAHWGSIKTAGLETDARRAVSTALGMRRALAMLNSGWRTRGMVELHFGIGINHGEAIVGNLGSEEKKEVSAIGDAVNLASRLEGVTKPYHIDLVIGELVAPFVAEHFVLRSVDLITVKGKTKPVEVFTVLGERPEDAEPAWLATHEEAMKLYRAGRFTEAAARWREVLTQCPEDGIAALFIERCEELAKNPPEEPWAGVFEMKTK
jgi:adenylate cyclase